ncbi:casein kinase YCK3 [Kluyveromyces lactis]|uniref:non-specific serine/threonine protein kinase n=1 Tax=Kluyveromyces lactis (strain ATCC 8585 / CBS 2359 / DSM 70799 / NBRC 1267 / NRRL Y-1140 / WM37) TaxID=284590 RepID=Q6CNC9_KLULA|nr:uncharacterized protein KLLA0_E13531g [Kluyveromyces lactis]CAG99647.1 KLLA0E13531p [Kluyveromyces lactis]|eukprot:XP_454560.1 uncharacterized protein KLLA0_E13531g [Kluyveromyces lactis]
MSKRSSQHVVGIHYAVGPKIGEGSFGIIFEGENILNGGSKNPVAIKFEPRRSDSPQLRDEFRAYRILNDVRGIPHAYYFSQEGIHNILIIDLLGPSLEDLFEWCSRKFSVKTTAMLAKQMIDRVRSIHEHDLIYRDIKPDNFLISEFQRELSDGSVVKSCATSSGGDANLIYVVDFGMAKQFRDPNTKQHIPYRERKSLSGTARYMSINTHFGREQSRRDDLESLGHVFFYFLRGSLPWQGLKALNNKAKYEKIGLTKQRLKPTDLLTPEIPKQFAEYLSYCRSLRFDQDPDYDYLISLMTQIMQENGYEEDGHYDWMDLNGGQGWNIKVNKRVNLHGYGNPTPRNTKHSAQQLTPLHQQQAQQQAPGQVQGQNHQQQNSRHDSRNYRSFSQSTPNKSQKKNVNSSMGNSRVRLSQGNGFVGPNVPLKQNLNIQSYDSMGKLHGRRIPNNEEYDDNDSIEEGGFFSKLCCGIC